MGCICSSPHPPSPRPPSPDPFIRTTIGDSKGSTLFFNEQDFDRVVLPKMDEDDRNTLLQPNKTLIVKVWFEHVEWNYVLAKVESNYKFELQVTNDWREVAWAMDLVEGDEVKLEYALEVVGSKPCFAISPGKIKPKPLLQIRGEPKDGTFLFTKGEFETHILPEMTEADRNTLSPDDGTLNVTIWYYNRELPFVLSKVEGDYKFEYVGCEGFAWRLDDLREGDRVRLRYLSQARFSLEKPLFP